MQNEFSIFYFFLDLPSPDDIAIVLREKSLGLIEKWSNRFGTYYESVF